MQFTESLELYNGWIQLIIIAQLHELIDRKSISK